MPSMTRLLLLPALAHAFMIVPRARTAAVAQPRAAVSALSREDFRSAAIAAVASAVLVMSPMAAHAKGGGHGGGGGGHGGGGHSSSHHSSSSSRPLYHSSHHSSRSRSSSSRSSKRTGSGYSSSSRGYSSTAYASPPPPMLLYPTESAARRENGYFCPANLPAPGKQVDIAGDGPFSTRTATVLSSQRPVAAGGLYDEAGAGRVLQPVPGFEGDCTVTVQYSDGSTETVYAAEQPTPLAETLGGLALYGGLYAAIFALDGTGGGASSSEDRWESTMADHDELLSELACAERPADEQMPPSGDYWGGSEESDAGNQAVRTTLKFRKDGKIEGRGRDGVDGAYRITKGRWGALDGDGRNQLTVTWVEVYDEGFQVAVKGRCDRLGRVTARFESSRGVRGSFELKPKPSAF